MDYMTLKEAAENWSVTPRRVNYYCAGGRIPGAVKMAGVWPVSYTHLAAVLAAVLRVRWSVHVGQKRDSFNPQAVYDDMHMNVARVIVSVRVGADNGLVSGLSLIHI